MAQQIAEIAAAPIAARSARRRGSPRCPRRARRAQMRRARRRARGRHDAAAWTAVEAAHCDAKSRDSPAAARAGRRACLRTQVRPSISMDRLCGSIPAEFRRTRPRGRLRAHRRMGAVSQRIRPAREAAVLPQALPAGDHRRAAKALSIRGGPARPDRLSSSACAAALRRPSALQNGLLAPRSSGVVVSPPDIPISGLDSRRHPGGAIE